MARQEPDRRTSIAFQGDAGAYSDLACRQRLSRRWRPCPATTFEDAFAAVREGRAALAMMPIENSVAGRVADIHHLMPDSGLHIIGEHFQRVNHHLLALPGATLADSEDRAQPCPRAVAMPQAHPRARARSRWSRPTRPAPPPRSPSAAIQTVAAIASELAGQIYGLVSLAAEHRGRRAQHDALPVMSREPRSGRATRRSTVTTFVFRVRNVPAALYKAMGGFATNGVNMTKLESYMVGGTLHRDAILRRCRGAIPTTGRCALALEELRFFSREVKILGVYPRPRVPARCKEAEARSRPRINWLCSENLRFRVGVLLAFAAFPLPVRSSRIAI